MYKNFEQEMFVTHAH